ncbi:hypothetical protein [Kosakonia sp. R1.Fl]|uniref:hypothetical protein n=1 Tax=Kosakonia sp. R1.Fl TaxID=2928706 RepID=UPI00201E1D9A|nr:hypothetical protein [Kosakonia sp. R1.Fl]MCL6744417.1 hypothetical protein [Kosakonia sp. R1.Fl]
MHFLNGMNGLFHLTDATTPSVMSNNVARIAKKINPAGAFSANYYRYTQPADFAPFEQECYYNVAKMIKLHGGEPIYGWVLWESANMIEGEAHCLYKSPEGEILDITPRVSGEEKILFLEDPSFKVSLKRVGENKFKMVQRSNPQLDIASDSFFPSKEVDLEFDQSEIRVIRLSEYEDSFLFY